MTARRLLPALLAALALLLLPAAASAAILERDGTFGSGVTGDRFSDPAGIAADDAGRIYVVDGGAGRVEVFDSAREGNRYLGSFGQGTLVRPLGIAMNPNDRPFVTDPGREQIIVFDTFLDGMSYENEVGSPGTVAGQLSGVRHIAAGSDFELAVAERGAGRLQLFTAKSPPRPLSTFDFGEPNTMTAPEGIARDRAARLFVSDESDDDGEIRRYGRPFGAYGYEGRIAGPGSGPGEVRRPRGLAVDSVGRLLVADAGNDRIQVLGRAEDGSGFVGAYDGAAGLLDEPMGITAAPGGYAYATDSATGRVVRFRYDDEDRDGALDARDVCPGRSDPAQRDLDRDGRGDECDEDDDNDGLGDGSDACPRTRVRAGANDDADRNGCADPRSKITTPRNGATFRARRVPKAMRGTATADRVGVSGVEVALAQVSGDRCRWYGDGRFGAASSCAEPSYFRASGGRRWSAPVRFAKARGLFRVISRARQNGGALEARLDARNVRTFRIR